MFQFPVKGFPRIDRFNLDFSPDDDVAGINVAINIVQGDTRGRSVHNAPHVWIRTPVKRQIRGVKVDNAFRKEIDEFLGKDRAEIDRYSQIRLKRTDRLNHIRTTEQRTVEDMGVLQFRRLNDFPGERPIFGCVNTQPNYFLPLLLEPLQHLEGDPIVAQTKQPRTRFKTLFAHGGL